MWSGYRGYAFHLKRTFKGLSLLTSPFMRFAQLQSTSLYWVHPLGRAFSTGSWGKGSEYHTTPPLKDLPAERVYLIYTVDVSFYARIYFSEKKSHHSVTEVKNHDGDRRVTKYKKEKTECLRKHWLEACPSLACTH